MIGRVRPAGRTAAAPRLKLTWTGSTLGFGVALARAVQIVKSVLFVCTGNICRSPIAEGLFRRMLGNRKDIEVVSAGVHAVRGQPPSLYAVEVCAEGGVDISNLRSQPLTAALIDRATHIFAMTGAHLETIQTLFPHGAE